MKKTNTILAITLLFIAGLNGEMFVNNFSGRRILETLQNRYKKGYLKIKLR